MIKFSVTTEKLKAALNCAPKDDVRFYLNGVHIEATPEHCYIVATDGACLYACHDTGAVLPSEPVSLILPRDKVEGIVKNKVKSTTITIHDDGSVEVFDVRFKPIDGLFPDWRKVIPSPDSVSVTNTASQFDPAILARCHKALGKQIILRHSVDGLKAGIMTGTSPDTEMCVVMPMRTDPKKASVWKSQW